MRAIGIRELKNHLSEYVRIANSGEVVLVTDRDRVVAELVQPSSARSHTDQLWASVVAHGIVRPPLVTDGSPPPFHGGSTTEEILELLAADREDR